MTLLASVYGILDGSLAPAALAATAVVAVFVVALGLAAYLLLRGFRR